MRSRRSLPCIDYRVEMRQVDRRSPTFSVTYLPVLHELALLRGGAEREREDGDRRRSCEGPHDTFSTPLLSFRVQNCFLHYVLGASLMLPPLLSPFP